ncbi:cupin domain-containing protein [Mesorhizobium sp. LSJC255A00]|uniref:cupin domain-containing protein n=1 Tax=Mesorhizobium sp. LSJC255A00 TaxID=1287313 RepID=UPI0004205878|nr:cupin domain-containing protein [Mesorhizobium sp. LSJC255A00]
MLKLASALALLLVGTAPLLADDMPINADAIKWGPAPAVLPAGADMAVIAGDPSKDGIYVLRLKLPAGYRIAAHNHPTSEYVTVISGNFHIGMGDKLDETKGIELTAGGLRRSPTGNEPLRLDDKRYDRPGSWRGAVRDHLRQPGGRS